MYGMVLSLTLQKELLFFHSGIVDYYNQLAKVIQSSHNKSFFFFIFVSLA